MWNTNKVNSKTKINLLILTVSINSVFLAAPLLAQENTKPAEGTQVPAENPKPEATTGNTKPQAASTAQATDNAARNTSPAKATVTTKPTQAPKPLNNVPGSNNSRKFIVQINDINQQLPDFYKQSIPGYRENYIKADGVKNPDGDAAENKQLQDNADMQSSGDSETAEDTGPSAMSRIWGWMEGFSFSQGLINALLLVLIVLIFVFYRLRGGGRRRI